MVGNEDIIKSTIREAGYEVWRAPESIFPDEEWVNAIQRGLSTSSHLLLVMSPAAVNSKWFELEMNTAIRLEREGRLTLILIDYQACDMPLQWGGYQAVDFQQDYETGLKHLLKRLAH